jgi:flagellar protein FlaJ
MFENIYEKVGRLFSREQIKSLSAILESSGLNLAAESFAGFITLFSLLFSLLVFILIVSVQFFKEFLFKLSLFLFYDFTVVSLDFFYFFVFVFSFAFGFGLIFLLVYTMLLLRINQRKRMVEGILPDFLSLASSNVRAGMTIDQALWYAAKPEFGILSEEISIVAKKSFSGVPFNEAIDYLLYRFDSKPVKRAVALIKQGIASGGKLADILDKTAEDSRKTQLLKKEISASLLMYVIFIIFASTIGVPFLFAISNKLIILLERIILSLNYPSHDLSFSYRNFVISSKPIISSSDFFLFTVLSAIITSIFSSLIIGVISKGSKKEGIVYIPFLLVGSLLMFFLVSYFLEGFLSNISI